MIESSPDSRLVERLVEGAESAAQQLDREYRARLSRKVANELNTRFRRREDPEDVVQSVLRTFCRRAAAGEFELRDADALWNLLQEITRKKILKHVEYHRAQKRDILSEENAEHENIPEESLSADARLLGDVLEAVLNEESQSSPDSEIMQLQLFGYSIEEIVSIILSDLPAPYPRILQLRLQGRTEHEIAAELECGREAIRYRLKRICERLQ